MICKMQLTQNFDWQRKQDFYGNPNHARAGAYAKILK